MTATNAHFAWLNYAEDGHPHALQPPEYWSIRTFAHHHPSWTAHVHTNCVLEGELWERLVSECPNLEPCPASLCEIPPRIGSVHGVQKSDWLLASRLLEHGGAKMDMADSVTVAPFDSLLASDARLQSFRDSRDRHFCTALMLSRDPGSEALRLALESIAGAGLDPQRRASFEVVMHRLHASRPALFAPRHDFRVAYPYFYDETAKLASIPALPPSCVHVHWWTSSDKPGGWTANKQAIAHVTPDNWRTAPGAYADCVRIAMTGKAAIQ